MSKFALLMAFMNATPVQLDGVESQSRISAPPSEAHTGLRLTSGGSIQGTEATSLNWGNSLGTWLLGGANSDWEVQFTKNSGDDPTSGTLNTWQGLGTTRALTMVQVGIGTSSGNFTVKIRSATSEAVFAEATFSLASTVSG